MCDKVSNSGGWRLGLYCLPRTFLADNFLSLFFFFAISLQAAYAAESIQIKEVWFHKTTCMKCHECGLRLNLKTYKVRLTVNRVGVAQDLSAHSFSPSSLSIGTPDLGFRPKRAFLCQVCSQSCANAGSSLCRAGARQSSFQDDSRGTYEKARPAHITLNILSNFSAPSHQVRLVNEQLRLERDKSDQSGVSGATHHATEVVSAAPAASSTSTFKVPALRPTSYAEPEFKPTATGGGDSNPRASRFAPGQGASTTPKCPNCGKPAYPAESIGVKEQQYHKACFKCKVCSTRLTLTTYKVRIRLRYRPALKVLLRLWLLLLLSLMLLLLSLTLSLASLFLPLNQVSDFGDNEIFCAKCVPKVAPTQAAATVELERAQRANEMTAEVGVCLPPATVPPLPGLPEFLAPFPLTMHRRAASTSRSVLEGLSSEIALLPAAVELLASVLRQGIKQP